MNDELRMLKVCLDYIHDTETITMTSCNEEKSQKWREKVCACVFTYLLAPLNNVVIS